MTADPPKIGPPRVPKLDTGPGERRSSMSLTFNFQNRSVVVTGAARGIGFEIARLFLAAGAKVAVWDYSEERLAHARTELKSANAFFQVVDVTNIGRVEKAAAELPFDIDILVNNAGITRDKSFAKMTDDDFSSVIDTNLGGVFHVTQKLLPKFSNTHSNKRIINISSVVALYGNFGQTNYVAAKAGVIGMTKTWARELARKGFTVNAIAPGFTATPMVEAMPEDVRTTMASKVPVARLGTPADIANACLFLASDEASYINGAVLSVDGGLVC